MTSLPHSQPVTSDAGFKGWNPDQFWEYVSGLAGAFEAEQMRAMLADMGLALSAPKASVEPADGAREAVAWIALSSDQEKVRIWWRDKERAEEWARTHSAPVIPLYASPACADAFLPLRAPQCGVQTPDDNWEDDPSADERWNAGVDFAITQLCAALGVDMESVSWDAATETVDGDVQAVIGNVMRAKYGDDWSGAALSLPEKAEGRESAPPALAKGTVYHLKNFGPAEYIGIDVYYGDTTHHFRTSDGSRFLTPERLASQLSSAQPLPDCPCKPGNCIYPKCTCPLPSTHSPGGDK